MFLEIQSLTCYQHGHCASLLEYFMSVCCFCFSDFSQPLVSSWKSSSFILPTFQLRGGSYMMPFDPYLFHTQHLLQFLVSAWMNHSFACLFLTSFRLSKLDSMGVSVAVR